MTIEKALENVKLYQAWRTGSDKRNHLVWQHETGITPAVLTESIDKLIAEVVNSVGGV
jgi:hypothetical protein